MRFRGDPGASTPTPSAREEADADRLKTKVTLSASGEAWLCPKGPKPTLLLPHCPQQAEADGGRVTGHCGVLLVAYHVVLLLEPTWVT